MRLPNGYGNVSKLPGKRRNPWRARKTAGWEITDVENGKKKQLYINIGCFPTKQEALQALSNYNDNPYNIHVDSITFSQVYDKWSEEHFKEIVPSAARTWKAAYKYCSPLYNMRMKDIRANHLEKTIQDADVGSNTKSRIKSMFNQIYKYSLKHEIVNKDYAALCNSVKVEKKSIMHIPFTKEEINILWENIDFPFVKMVLIGIYSGWRPQELAILETENINLSEGAYKGGLKTDAGKNRIVPIHSKVLPLVEELYNEDNKYLFNDINGQQGTYMTYDKYRARFKKACDYLKLNHKPHDTRHTFITLAKEAGVDEYCIKLMVGHAIQDITEGIYTHRTLKMLKNEIEKIK